MAASRADVINIDLEDSVAPSDKVSARKNAISAINEINWGNKTLSVRINGLDTSYWYRDVVDLVEKNGWSSRPNYDSQSGKCKRYLRC
jgi:malyl-CoA/(S)-citramalyl-CoA lyase